MFDFKSIFGSKDRLEEFNKLSGEENYLNPTLNQEMNDLFKFKNIMKIANRDYVKNNLLPLIESINIDDYHIHSIESHDGRYPIQTLVEAAKENGVKSMAISDHNSLRAVIKFGKENGAKDSDVIIHTKEGVDVIPAVEITCVVSKFDNTKIHLIAYCPILNENSPLVRLIELKAKNEDDINFNYITYVADKLGVNISENQIEEYDINNGRIGKSFKEFSQDDAAKFFISMGYSKNLREILQALNSTPRTERMILDAADVIALAHESGALVCFAHPGVNLSKMAESKENAPKLVEYLYSIGLDMYEKYYRNDVIKIDKDFDINHGDNRLFTSAGSDTHTELEDIGYIHNKPILEKSITAPLAFKLLELAREAGFKTFRSYKDYLTKEQIEKIISKYSRSYNIAPQVMNHSKIPLLNNLIEQDKRHEKALRVHKAIEKHKITDNEIEYILKNKNAGKHIKNFFNSFHNNNHNNEFSSHRKNHGKHHQNRYDKYRNGGRCEWER
jgi:predicted metal-dependent phosphoesterase TrpH